MTTATDIQSAAELERQRLAAQAAQARASAQTQAQQAETQTQTQAQQAIFEAQRQVQVAKTEAQREAETRQAQIRKQRGAAEREAQAAMGRARQAQTIEQRKVVLPVTKPRQLGTASYIANVETARRQAHQAGSNARTAVTKVRDDYFKQVDKARDDAVADINKQKAGIIADIQTQLVNYNADLTKQLAQLNSGVNEWEADSKAKIQQAQADYEAAVKAALNRSGTDVFTDMTSKGLIPADAIYDSYDKTTGQLNYTIPDMRSGEEIFEAEQKAGNIKSNATFKSYDSSTGVLTFTIPSNETVSGQSTQTVNPGQNSTNVITASGFAMPALAAMAIVGTGSATLETGLWTAAAFDPEPFSKIALLIAAAVATYFIAKKVDSVIRDSQKAKEAAQGNAVVTDNAGTAAYTIQQISFIPQAKGGTILTEPTATPPLPAYIIDTFPPSELPQIMAIWLEQQERELPSIPIPQDKRELIIRDPWTSDPLGQGKLKDVLIAALATQQAATHLQRVITKEMPMTREQWEVVEDALRQGRVAEGKRIIGGLAKKADTPEIARNLTQAYREYLRKKAILDAARKSYVASLNPQPIKGKASNKAMAAAIGLWLAQDIIQGQIVKSLNNGESLETAMAKAQTKLREMSKELGLTQQQINAATATVVYQAALSSMAQEAVKAASMAQSQGLTATQVQTQTLTATKTAAQTAVQNAVATQTLTLSQAVELAQELDSVAEAVAEYTVKIKLPKVKTDAQSIARDKYPDGTVAWRMGETKGDVYKIIPPPYTMLKPITSRYPPKGMVRTKGTPQQTLTFIGGKVPFENVSFDLGVTDGFIDVKSRTIKFTGRGQQTNVGTRIESTTKGVALTHNPPMVSQRRYEISRPQRSSHGSVGYIDKTGRRLSRRHHRGFKKVRFS